MECYEKDFEEHMLKDTAEYYRRKAAVWIQVRGPRAARRQRRLVGVLAARGDGCGAAVPRAAGARRACCAAPSKAGD